MTRCLAWDLSVRRAHAQRILHEAAQVDHARAVERRLATLHRDHVTLAQSQEGRHSSRVLTSEDMLVVPFEVLRACLVVLELPACDLRDAATDRR